MLAVSFLGDEFTELSTAASRLRKFEEFITFNGEELSICNIVIKSPCFHNYLIPYITGKISLQFQYRIKKSVKIKS